MGCSLEHYEYAILVSDKYGREYFAHVIAYDHESACNAAATKLGFRVESVTCEILSTRQLNRL